MTYWILFLYISVLLLTTVFVPDDTLSLKEMEQVDTDEKLSDFDRKLSKGEFDKIDEQYLINKNSFHVDQINHCRLNLSNENGLQVFVERKTSNDEKIEAFIFSNGLILDGYDFCKY